MATQKTTPGRGGFDSSSGGTLNDLNKELPGETGLGSGLGSGTSGFGSDGFGTTATGDRGLQDVASQVPSVAGVIDQVKQQASSRVNEQKARAAEGLGSVASAIRSASENLRSENQTLATYADKAVDQIQLFADRMRDKDPAEMVRDAERFARRNPAAFVGGAFVLGLALARFLKSSGETGATQRGLTHYDSDFGDSGGATRSYAVPGETGFARPGSFARVDDLAQSGGHTTDAGPGITS